MNNLPTLTWGICKTADNLLTLGDYIYIYTQIHIHICVYIYIYVGDSLSISIYAVELETGPRVVLKAGPSFSLLSRFL